MQRVLGGVWQGTGRMPRGCYAWQMGGVEDGPKPHTEVVKRERVREAAPKLDGQAPSKRVDAWKRDHSDFPALKSDSNKSGWVAGLCFLFGPPAGQPGLRTLSACRLPGGHKGRDSHPSASWLPLLAALVCRCWDQRRALLVGGFMFASEPGAGRCIRWAASYTGCSSPFPDHPQGLSGLSLSKPRACLKAAFQLSLGCHSGQEVHNLQADLGHLPPNKARKGEDTLTRELLQLGVPVPPQKVNEPL